MYTGTGAGGCDDAIKVLPGFYLWHRHSPRHHRQVAGTKLTGSQATVVILEIFIIFDIHGIIFTSQYKWRYSNISGTKHMKKPGMVAIDYFN